MLSDCATNLFSKLDVCERCKITKDQFPSGLNIRLGLKSGDQRHGEHLDFI